MKRMIFSPSILVALLLGLFTPVGISQQHPCNEEADAQSAVQACEEWVTCPHHGVDEDGNSTGKISCCSVELGALNWDTCRTRGWVTGKKCVNKTKKWYSVRNGRCKTVHIGMHKFSRCVVDGWNQAPVGSEYFEWDYDQADY